jgi:hypothetical protein
MERIAKTVRLPKQAAPLVQVVTRRLPLQFRRLRWHLPYPVFFAAGIVLGIALGTLTLR